MDVGRDIDLDMAVSIDWGSFKTGVSLRGVQIPFWVDIGQV